MSGIHRRDGSDFTFYGTGGFYKDLLSPVISGLGFTGDGYVGVRNAFEGESGGADGGLRVGLFSPVARLAWGLDYNFNDDESDLYLSVIHPLKRGGVFTKGGSFRIDYLPGRNHSVSIGIQLPTRRRWLGSTRPRNDHVRLLNPDPPPIPFEPTTVLAEAMANTEQLGHWVNRLVVPFTDQWDGNKDKALDMFMEEMTVIGTYLNGTDGRFYGGARTPTKDVAAFHDELDRAFSIAATGRSIDLGGRTAVGSRIADKAREIVLEYVILPYDRLLGQKRREDSTRGFGASASAAFYEWLLRETPIAEENALATVWTFARYLDVIEETRRFNRERWVDSRFVWVPLQLALRAEEHDEQSELNALIERATGVTFSAANAIWYVENEQFQTELSRMILEAKDHHVLWIHDFRGYDAEGDPDEMAYRQVTGAYLPALIQAVVDYDQTGKIPQYIQIIDQFFFHANQGRLWTNLLEDPLSHEIDLPKGFENWEDSIAGLQDQLREAVRNSVLLQAQAAHFEDGWIENLVKVHVNVTHPPDPSFWTSEMFPFFMGLPDVHMRDHRKISFYDVSEADPYAGRGIYTGMGVGEHYVGAGWEDRAIMAQGPVLLQLRNSARQLLLNQGFAEHEIPWSLQSKPYGPGYQEKIRDYLDGTGDIGLAMEVHNQVGFRAKGVTVLKAILYTLMPPGAVIKAPDSIWNANLWASMMLGHALRGGRSLVIAPAIANAPSAGSPQMSRAQELLARLIVADQMLGDVIEARGGLMKVGLYSTPLHVGDVPGRISSLLDNLENTPWLRDLYGFDPAVTRNLAEVRQELIDDGFERLYAVDQNFVRAKLHMKAHLYFSREAWNGLLGLEGMGELFRAHFEETAETNRALSTGANRDFRAYTERLRPIGASFVVPYLETVTAAEQRRMAMFLTVGSHNQNSRSLALDGEVAFLTAGWNAVSGLMDFVVLVGLSTWIDDMDELEALFPGYEGLSRRIGRFIRISVE